MADAAKGIRQLVLLHGREQARQMVDPDDRALVKIASEVLADESGQKGPWCINCGPMASAM
jgi:hypothetical protein